MPAKKAARKPAKKMPPPRVPVLDEAELTGDQRALPDSIRSGPRGGSTTLRGPFAVFLHAPVFGEPAQKLGGPCRFKAAVPAAGIANLVSFNYMAYYHDYLAVEFGSFPHEAGLIDLLWERSPLKYANKVKTPTLFIHGENDNDVPIAEAEQFYIALKDVGVETIMIRYPREGHGIRETAHTIDLVDRSIAWYEKHFR